MSTWGGSIRKWIGSLGSAGFGTSLVLHAILLILFSLWFIELPDRGTPLDMILDQSEGLDMDAELDVAMELPGPQEPEIAAPQFQQVPDVAEALEVEPENVKLPGTLPPAVANADGPGEGNDGRVGSNAVRQGSFTVWTVPANPAPFQRYRIFVQIDLPEGIKDYDRTDLSGKMVGTDGFETPIGHYTGGGDFRFPQVPGYYGYFNRTLKRLILTIPGGANQIRDRITVHSDVLDETQEIEIVFENARNRRSGR